MMHDHVNSGGSGKFFIIALSHDSLENYYKLNFQMIHRFNYSLAEIENMIPWEREVSNGVILSENEKEV